MDRSRHSRGLPRLCTLRQRCRQSPQRSSRVPNRSMWMIMYSSVSSTLVTVCAFSPSCFLINVSTSTSILFLSMAVNNSPQRIRCIEVSSPGQPAVKLLEPNHFSSNYTFGTGTQNPGLYWSSTPNTSDKSTALSYIPESAWNESGDNGGSGLVAPGGGPSPVCPKPPWQVAPGVPPDNARDVPDVALTAAVHDGYVVVQGGVTILWWTFGSTTETLVLQR